MPIQPLQETREHLTCTVCGPFTVVYQRGSMTFDYAFECPGCRQRPVVVCSYPIDGEVLDSWLGHGDDPDA